MDSHGPSPLFSGPSSTSEHFLLSFYQQTQSLIKGQREKRGGRRRGGGVKQETDVHVGRGVQQTALYLAGEAAAWAGAPAPSLPFPGRRQAPPWSLAVPDLRKVATVTPTAPPPETNDLIQGDRALDHPRAIVDTTDHISARSALFQASDLLVNKTNSTVVAQH